MKKLIIILTAVIVLVLSVYPVSAFAESRSVTEFNVSCVNGQIYYSGTVATGVKAAAVLLFDSDGNLIMMDTCEVNNSGVFSGEMSISLTSTAVGGEGISFDNTALATEMHPQCIA